MIKLDGCRHLSNNPLHYASLALFASVIALSACSEGGTELQTETSEQSPFDNASTKPSLSAAQLSNDVTPTIQSALSVAAADETGTTQGVSQALNEVFEPAAANPTPDTVTPDQTVEEVGSIAVSSSENPAIAVPDAEIQNSVQNSAGDNFVSAATSVRVDTTCIDKVIILIRFSLTNTVTLTFLTVTTTMKFRHLILKKTTITSPLA